jgi:hypothetical protein
MFPPELWFLNRVPFVKLIGYPLILLVVGVWTFAALAVCAVVGIAYLILH